VDPKLTRKILLLLITAGIFTLISGTATAITPDSSQIPSTKQGTDLIVSELKSPEKGVKGCHISVSSIIKNQGTKNSPSFWVNYYLKTKTSPKKVYLGQKYVKNLSTGKLFKNTQQLSLPLTLNSGYYYIYAQADRGWNVLETNEYNNNRYSSKPIKIVGPQFSLFDTHTGGNVVKNSEINNYIPHTEYALNLFSWLNKGSIVLKYGDGSGSPILISAGIHGNETEANISIMKYLEYIKDKNIKGTLYVIPFALPYSTSINSRFYHGYDPNRRAHVTGTPGWNIIQFARNKGIKYILDVHSGLSVPYNGLLNLNPSIPSVGLKWASYISHNTGCGYVFKSMDKGMLRTESAKYGINHVTIEVDRTRISTLSAANTELKIINAACRYFGFPALN
jgi:hypothetical protein